MSRLRPAAFMTEAMSETAKPITKSRKALPVTAMVCVCWKLAVLVCGLGMVRVR